MKKIIPKKVLNLRHLFYAWRGAVKYGHPSEELLVIGITGTSGKSSTSYILRQLLESAGYTVGVLSTVEFYVAGKQKWNDQKMTMLGRMQIQKYLRKMVEAGCDVAIVETTSEGYLQFRHRSINYDMMVLTNLYPEHIDSHGSFQNYKNAKLGIFKYVSKSKRKILKGEKMDKVSIVNGDSEYAVEFLNIPYERSVLYVRNDEELFVESSRLKNNIMFVLSKDLISDKDGLHFRIGDSKFDIAMYGEHNVSNILAAVSVCRAMNVSIKKIEKAVNKLENVPGRIEFIREAEKKGFRVIVDYAFEPVAIKKLYSVLEILKPKRIIHVFGSTGGGRDMERRFTVGGYVGKNADIAIVTDEDPYDDDPIGIIDDVASAVEKAGKKLGKDLFKILSRKDAIEKAISMAKKGDVVLVTGKGSEQAMVVRGKLFKWDDREVVRKVLNDR